VYKILTKRRGAGGNRRISADVRGPEETRVIVELSDRKKLRGDGRGRDEILYMIPAARADRVFTRVVWSPDYTAGVRSALARRPAGSPSPRYERLSQGPRGPVRARINEVWGAGEQGDRETCVCTRLGSTYVCIRRRRRRCLPRDCYLGETYVGLRPPAAPFPFSLRPPTAVVSANTVAGLDRTRL